MSKKAFGIISAIFILLLLSTIALMILSIQSNSIKHSVDSRMRSQAVVLAHSGIDYALMLIQGFDRSGGNCLEYIDIEAKPFDVNISLWYMFSAGQKPHNCKNCSEGAVSQKQNGTVIVDVVVKTQTGLNIEPVRVHKRHIGHP